MTNEYTELGGHENAVFRLNDEQIQIYSTEEDTDGDEIGVVGNIPRDEFTSFCDDLRGVFEDEEEGIVAPEWDDIVVGQGPLGGIVFVATDDDGQKDMERGAVFHDPQDIIEAADAL